jgi:DNA-binding CsgD family transcriptional regulator
LDLESRTVLHLLVQGQRVGQIAYHLQIPLRRVYWVREKLRRRFGANSNEHLVRRATTEGFISPHD